MAGLCDHTGQGRSRAVAPAPRLILTRARPKTGDGYLFMPSKGDHMGSPLRTSPHVNSAHSPIPLTAFRRRSLSAITPPPVKSPTSPPYPPTVATISPPYRQRLAGFSTPKKCETNPISIPPSYRWRLAGFPIPAQTPNPRSTNYELCTIMRNEPNRNPPFTIHRKQLRKTNPITPRPTPPTRETNPIPQGQLPKANSQ